MPKIAVEHRLVYFGQGGEVYQCDAFVGLVHGLADQAELSNWSIVFDESCVRCATRGAEFRPDASDALDHV